MNRTQLLQMMANGENSRVKALPREGDIPRCWTSKGGVIFWGWGWRRPVACNAGGQV